MDKKSIYNNPMGMEYSKIPETEEQRLDIINEEQRNKSKTKHYSNLVSTFVKTNSLKTKKGGKSRKYTRCKRYRHRTHYRR